MLHFTLKSLTSKKSLILIFVFILLILTPLIIFLISKFATPPTPSEIFIKQTQNFIDKNNGDNEIPEEISDIFDTLNDKTNSDKDQYEALKSLSFYFSSAYSESKKPDIRDYNSKYINDYAKNYYSNLYKNYDFIIPCSDPTCGQSLDSEISEAIKIIDTSKLDKDIKNTIIENLKTAGYTPDLENKKIGLTLSISQLKETNDKDASKAADLLYKYAKEKYNIEQ